MFNVTEHYINSMNKERIELHCHSKNGGCSALHVGAVMRHFSEAGAPAFAITDESNTYSFPELEALWHTGRYSSRPIYGIEMRVFDGESEDIYNISVLVRNKQGMQNLNRLITETNTAARYPVFNLEKLLSLREGLLIGSGVDNGNVYRSILMGAADDEIINLLKIYDYAEVIPDRKYQEITVKIIELCRETGTPVVAVSDGRYKDDLGRVACRAMQKYSYLDLDVNDRFFKSTSEMLDAFSYLGDEEAYEIVVENTHKIAAMCESIEVCPPIKNYPRIDNADTKLRNICFEALYDKYELDSADVASKRLEWELSAIKSRDMSSFLLMTRNLLKENGLRACDISIRGTGSGSMVVYLLGIGETDPLKYHLEPETIFSLDGLRELYMDINVPVSKQEKLLRKIKKLDGVGKAVRAGLITVVSEQRADEMLKQYMMYTDSGISIDEQQIIRLLIAGNYKGRTIHPGGVVIFPDDYDYMRLMPVADMENGEEMTYYDYHSIDRSFLKFSLLKHDTSEMLMMLSKKCKVDLNDVPVDDPDVLKLFEYKGNSDIMGCEDLPDFSSEFVRKIMSVLRPKSFNDLVKISAISHGTDVWLNNGELLALNDGIGIDELIADRDDIFEYLMSLGIERDTAFKISEEVRKGKVCSGRSARWNEWKEIMLEAGVPQWYVWSCEQIKYLFPRAHAVAYVNMSMRLGWFKIHYPEDFALVLAK